MKQSAFEVELAIDKLKSHKLAGIDEIPAELTADKGWSSLGVGRGANNPSP